MSVAQQVTDALSQAQTNVTATRDIVIPILSSAADKLSRQFGLQTVRG
jgi:hypothetical protein